jgi:hypothetical protein
MAADLRFTPDDVETQVFDWGLIKWMSEARVTGAACSTGGVAGGPEAFLRSLPDRTIVPAGELPQR